MVIVVIRGAPSRSRLLSHPCPIRDCFQQDSRQARTMLRRQERQVSNHGDQNEPLNRIVRATTEALVVEIDGERRPLPWTMVDNVYATVVADDDDIVVMAFEVRDRDGPRCMLVGQSDAVWAELKAVLHIGLPGTLPIELWEQALIDLPMVMPVFHRDRGAKTAIGVIRQADPGPRN